MGVNSTWIKKDEPDITQPVKTKTKTVYNKDELKQVLDQLFNELEQLFNSMKFNKSG